MTEVRASVLIPSQTTALPGGARPELARTPVRGLPSGGTGSQAPR